MSSIPNVFQTVVPRSTAAPTVVKLKPGQVLGTNGKVSGSIKPRGCVDFYLDPAKKYTPWQDRIDNHRRISSASI